MLKHFLPKSKNPPSQPPTGDASKDNDAKASVTAPVYVTIIQKHKQAEFSNTQGLKSKKTHHHVVTPRSSYDKHDSAPYEKSLYYGDMSPKPIYRSSDPRLAKRSPYYKYDDEHPYDTHTEYKLHKEDTYEKGISLKAPYSVYEHRPHHGKYSPSHDIHTKYLQARPEEILKSKIYSLAPKSQYITVTKAPRYHDEYDFKHHKTKSYIPEFETKVLSNYDKDAFNDHAALLNLKKALREAQKEIDEDLLRKYLHPQIEHHHKTTRVIEDVPISYEDIIHSTKSLHENHRAPKLLNPSFYKYKTASHYEISPDIPYDIHPELHHEVLSQYREEPLLPYHEDPSFYHKSRLVPVPPPLPSPFKNHPHRLSPVSNKNITIPTGFAVHNRGKYAKSLSIKKYVKILRKVTPIKKHFEYPQYFDDNHKPKHNKIYAKTESPKLTSDFPPFSVPESEAKKKSGKSGTSRREHAKATKFNGPATKYKGPATSFIRSGTGVKYHKHDALHHFKPPLHHFKPRRVTKRTVKTTKRPEGHYYLTRELNDTNILNLLNVLMNDTEDGSEFKVFNIPMIMTDEVVLNIINSKYGNRSDSTEAMSSGLGSSENLKNRLADIMLGTNLNAESTKHMKFEDRKVKTKDSMLSKTKLIQLLLNDNKMSDNAIKMKSSKFMDILKSKPETSLGTKPKVDSYIESQIKKLKQMNAIDDARNRNIRKRENPGSINKSKSYMHLLSQLGGERSKASRQNEPNKMFEEDCNCSMIPGVDPRSRKLGYSALN